MKGGLLKRSPSPGQPAATPLLGQADQGTLLRTKEEGGRGLGPAVVWSSRWVQTKAACRVAATQQARESLRSYVSSPTHQPWGHGGARPETGDTVDVQAALLPCLSAGAVLGLTSCPQLGYGHQQPCEEGAVITAI